MKKSWGLMASLALLSTQANAEDYRVELETSAGVWNYSTRGLDVESNQYQTALTYHFSTVDTSQGPLLAAGFLDKSSFVRLTYAGDDNTLTSPFTSSIDRDRYAVAARAVLENDLVLSAQYTKQESSSHDDFALAIGAYITDTVEVDVSYEKDNNDRNDSQEINVEVTAFTALENNKAITLNANMGYIDEDGELGFTGRRDDNSGYQVSAGALYFFSRAFSIGANVLYIDQENDDFLRSSIYSHYFVTPKISLGLSYTDFRRDLDGDAIFGELNVRL